MKSLLMLVSYICFRFSEHLSPLRSTIEPGILKIFRNFALAALGFIVIQPAIYFLLMPLCNFVETHSFGITKLLEIPHWLEVTLSIVLLDYTLYIWHILTHRIPLLWRFHKVHHVDLDLNASTAFRFHFGEHIFSIPWRVGQILLIGVSPTALVLWQSLLLMEIMFHHSNLKLPRQWDRYLNFFIVTPRMHSIHHSIVQTETDSNFSSGLTLWDKLHGTFVNISETKKIEVGVPPYKRWEDLRFRELILMPFVKQNTSWEFPDGTKPTR